MSYHKTYCRSVKRIGEDEEEEKEEQRKAKKQKIIDCKENIRTKLPHMSWYKPTPKIGNEMTFVSIPKICGCVHTVFSDIYFYA